MLDSIDKRTPFIWELTLGWDGKNQQYTLDEEFYASSDSEPGLFALYEADEKAVLHRDRKYQFNRGAMFGLYLQLNGDIPVEKLPTGRCILKLNFNKQTPQAPNSPLKRVLNNKNFLDSNVEREIWIPDLRERRESKKNGDPIWGTYVTPTAEKQIIPRTGELGISLWWYLDNPLRKGKIQYKLGVDFKHANGEASVDPIIIIGGGGGHN